MIILEMNKQTQKQSLIQQEEEISLDDRSVTNQNDFEGCEQCHPKEVICESIPTEPSPIHKRVLHQNINVPLLKPE